MKNPQQVTALHLFCGREYSFEELKMAEALVEKMVGVLGVDCLTDKHDTPLHYCCQGAQDVNIAKVRGEKKRIFFFILILNLILI